MVVQNHTCQIHQDYLLRCDDIFSGSTDGLLRFWESDDGMNGINLFRLISLRLFVGCFCFQFTHLLPLLLDSIKHSNGYTYTFPKRNKMLNAILIPISSQKGCPVSFSKGQRNLILTSVLKHME